MTDIYKLHKRFHFNMTFSTTLLPESSTVVIWTEALYFAKEGETVMVAVYREGYLGSSTETVGKLYLHIPIIVV